MTDGETGIKIRIAEARDIKEIAELEKICFSSPWSEESIAREINENRLALYVVAADEAIGVVGYAGIWNVAGEGYITNVAVHPDYRGRHIGEAIVRALIDRAEAAGALAETLEVRVSNVPAQRLYEKLGFSIAGTRKGYYEDNGEDAYIMWRR